MKDWTGNKKTTFTCLGASNHAEHDREINDYYATDPKAAELLLEVEPELDNIWECACGEGHLAKVFDKANKLGLATDKIYRGYGNLNPLDFLTYDDYWNGDIVTNPPYKFAKEFIEKLDKALKGKKTSNLGFILSLDNDDTGARYTAEFVEYFKAKRIRYVICNIFRIFII